MLEILIILTLLLSAATTSKLNYETLTKDNNSLEGQNIDAGARTTTTFASDIKDIITTTPLVSSLPENPPEKVSDPSTGNSPSIVTTEEPLLLPPLQSAQDDYKRRIITYDQRQEGQYNIRADLENFMIVLIPPGREEGLNLLDLLTKSSLRRSSTHSTKGKRKHYATRTSIHSEQNGQGMSSKKAQFLKRAQQHQAASDTARSYSQLSQPLAILTSPEGSVGSHAMPDFVEGRTPYHVDISANDDEQASRIQPDRQVDVLPPPYFPQLIRPYHLEAEPTLIQALPPAEISNAGSFLEGYSKLLNTDLRNNANANAESRSSPNSAESGFYRFSRALRGDNFLDTNRLGVSKFELTPRSTNVPLFRADFASERASDNSIYPPIDIPYLNGNGYARTWRLTNIPDESQQQLQHKRSDANAYDFDLLNDNADILDDAKSLLGTSIGIERCAPGHRRDSYGLCREITGY